MSKQAIVKIENNTYIIDAFKGLDGWKLLPRVTKLILPFLFSAQDLDEEDASEELKALNEEKTIEILMNLLSGDNADDLIDLVPKLLSNVTKNSEVIDFDKEFSQNYMVMFKLVFEVIKLNYISSFQKLATKE
jgi:hypothetical protein